MTSRPLTSAIVGLGLFLPLVPTAAAGAVVDAAASPVMVWESGGLSPSTIEAARVAASTQSAPIHLRRSGTLRLMGVTRAGADVQRPQEGFGYPMSTLSVASDDPMIGAGAMRALPSDAVVMSERSAELRGARAGDVLELEGWNREVFEVTLAQVVPDEALDWYEIVMTTPTAEMLDMDRESSMVIDAERPAVMMSALRWLVRSPTVRFGSAESPVVFTDATLPTVIVKERFGEFSFRPTGRGDGIAMDQEWLDRNIVTVDLEGLGPFRCNRAVVPYLRAAIDELRQSGLMDAIDYTDFQLAGGCFNARLMRGGDKGYALSRHAWGIAIDFNPSTNPYGGPVALEDPVGEVLRRWGFSWGATWTVPDGMHFEWARTPQDIQICSPFRLWGRESTTVTWQVESSPTGCAGVD